MRAIGDHGWPAIGDGSIDIAETTTLTHRCHSGYTVAIADAARRACHERHATAVADTRLHGHTGGNRVSRYTVTRSRGHTVTRPHGHTATRAATVYPAKACVRLSRLGCRLHCCRLHCAIVTADTRASASRAARRSDKELPLLHRCVRSGAG